jgi:hypothetical protein
MDQDSARELRGRNFDGGISVGGRRHDRRSPRAADASSLGRGFAGGEIELGDAVGQDVGVVHGVRLVRVPRAAVLVRRVRSNGRDGSRREIRIIPRLVPRLVLVLVMAGGTIRVRMPIGRGSVLMRMSVSMRMRLPVAFLRVG